MSMLEPISGLSFDEHRHRYAYNGQWMTRSVTKVVQGELDEAARKRIEETKHIWAPRGTAVHSALEHHLLGKGVVMPVEYSSIIDPLLDHPLWEGAETLAVEYRLVDAGRSLAGCFDFLIRTRKGSIVLGDLKTVGSTSGVASRKPAAAQLGGYACMLMQHHPWLVIDRCVTVVAGPELTELKVSDPQDCVDAWEEAWGRYQADWALRYDF